jgi:hypothetical protein
MWVMVVAVNLIDWRVCWYCPLIVSPHPYIPITQTTCRSVQNKAKHDREIMEKTFLNGEAGACNA